MNVLEWMDSLEAFQVIIYRRPNFLSPDFEFESYISVQASCATSFTKRGLMTQRNQSRLYFLRDGLTALSATNC